MRVVVGWVVGLLATCIVGCGGGGGAGGGNPPPGGGGGAGWTQGVFAAASTYAAQCTIPRVGIDPDTGRPYPDRQGTTRDENNWLRSWSNDLYLWYAEIVDRDPALYQTAQYFELLKTTAITASGQPKDRFHFSLATDTWRALSQAGTSAGYGAAWAILSPTPPRDVRIAYTEPNSPATSAAVNLARGARILRVDGVDLINDDTQAGVDALNAGLFPEQTGETHDFEVQDLGSANSRIVPMTSENVTLAPVQSVKTIATPQGLYGYMLSNDHLATAEQALKDAIETLAAQNIDQLIVDMRYNSGGYLVVASQLAYMIAGANRTAGRTFERLRFNDKHPTRDPVTGQAITPTPFVDEGVGLSVPGGTPLPDLNLDRVYFLIGADTCSSPETVINGLQGIDFDVVLIGASSCGKPYGYYPQDNCGTTYFSIQFKGENAKGFGDYTDGFTPTTNAQAPIGERVTGCYVEDDFAHALGDPAERRLQVALDYAQSGCPVGVAAQGQTGLPRAPVEHRFIVAKPDAMRGKIL